MCGQGKWPSLPVSEHFPCLDTRERVLPCALLLQHSQHVSDPRFSIGAMPGGSAAQKITVCVYVCVRVHVHVRARALRIRTPSQQRLPTSMEAWA